MEGRVRISNTQHSSCGTAEPVTTSSWGREAASMAGLQITMSTGSWKALIDSEEAGMRCTASNSEQLSVSLFAAYSLEHLDARLLHHTLSSQTALQCIPLLPLSCSPLTSSPLPSFPYPPLLSLPSLPPPLSCTLPLTGSTIHSKEQSSSHFRAEVG